MELLKYYEANNSDVDFSERQRHLEFIAEKLKTTLSAQMTSERIINEIDSSSPDFMEESQ
ncbi:MAG: hypothetical protein JST59_01690 [Actinobacteria bacterium]|nr:hypothetical protein [Actinomycetota bacterium]